MTSIKMALKDLRTQRFTAAILFLLFLCTTFVIVGGALVTNGSLQGVQETQNRLGADVIVVPSSYSTDMQNALFEGEAATVDMDRTWLETLAQMDGISKISAQRYIATLSADCCSAGGIQMIAYDPDTDFTIGKWLSKQEIATPKKNEIIMGSATGFSKGETVQFFGVEFTVIGILEETGMGYDTGAFISFEAAQEIASQEGYSIVYPTRNGVEQISMILIEVEDGYEPEKIKQSILNYYEDDGIHAYSKATMVSTLFQKIESMSKMMNIFQLALVLVSAIGVFAVITIYMSFRKPHIGYLLSNGVAAWKVWLFFAGEYLLVLVLAHVIADTLVIFLIYAFEMMLKLNLEMPFVIPGVWEMVKIIIKSFLVNLAVLFVAAVYSLIRMIRLDISLIVKEDIR
ncbi:ABC transporter permease [Eubacterium oxidoreducens]|uniref:MacB-like core domain-containing protein n=1 Tax=Eubacterium oxidoreducens TaxID=1732 RepID=A0A1G6C230_EUBOX|nr:ABC transporter permease [Eubacterium oxidoreducens]SDB26907.1 MacB-like core domain-containing protein [Eubacterium oxidoreducens]